MINEFSMTRDGRLIAGSGSASHTGGGDGEVRQLGEDVVGQRVSRVRDGQSAPGCVI